HWDKADFMPRPDDIFQERLYAIQWITKDTLGTNRQETFFASVTDDDLARERQVEAIVRQELVSWQHEGLAPDMLIQPGENTTQPMRERGWTYWHHLFGPRHLLMASMIRQQMRFATHGAAVALSLSRALNYLSKLTQWMPRTPTPRSPADVVNHVFYNQ